MSGAAPALPPPHPSPFALSLWAPGRHRPRLAAPDDQIARAVAAAEAAGDGVRLAVERLTALPAWRDFAAALGAESAAAGGRVVQTVRSLAAGTPLRQRFERLLAEPEPREAYRTVQEALARHRRAWQDAGWRAALLKAGEEAVLDRQSRRTWELAALTQGIPAGPGESLADMLRGMRPGPAPTEARPRPVLRVTAEN